MKASNNNGRRTLDKRLLTDSTADTHLCVEHAAGVAAVHHFVPVLLEADLVKGAAHVSHGHVREGRRVTLRPRQHTHLFPAKGGGGTRDKKTCNKQHTSTYAILLSFEHITRRERHAPNPESTNYTANSHRERGGREQAPSARSSSPCAVPKRGTWRSQQRCGTCLTLSGQARCLVTDTTIPSFVRICSSQTIRSDWLRRTTQGMTVDNFYSNKTVDKKNSATPHLRARQRRATQLSGPLHYLVGPCHQTLASPAPSYVQYLK